MCVTRLRQYLGVGGCLGQRPRPSDRNASKRDRLRSRSADFGRRSRRTSRRVPFARVQCHCGRRARSPFHHVRFPNYRPGNHRRNIRNDRRFRIVQVRYLRFLGRRGPV